MNRTQTEVFSREDLIAAGLWGGPNSAERRRQTGKILGIGYGNCNSFLKRLNQFLISKEEFNEAIHHISNP
jgi:ribonuclease M5